MSRIAVVAGRELKGYFASWLAYVFIGVFVLASMVTFFWVGEFFGTGRADVTPFFEWIPVTLLALVPGLTMRQWAREQEMGSIEILLTLPARGAELVTGKLIGTVGLVAVGLLFTLGIPITAAMLGDLDWGPVVTGYVAALLLGAAYVSIGLFVSSWFSDQFLALICALIACSVFGLMSTPRVIGWVAEIPWLAATLEHVGFWSRFESITRGVLDFRDVLYYASVTVLFCFLNVTRLQFKRWS